MPNAETGSQADRARMPVIERPLTREEAERSALMFKALSDPVRLLLFSQVAARHDEVCVCEISDVGVSAPTVSFHLKKLREAGLVTSERRGTWVYYRATPYPVTLLVRMLGLTGA